MSNYENASIVLGNTPEFANFLIQSKNTQGVFLGTVQYQKNFKTGELEKGKDPYITSSNIYSMPIASSILENMKQCFQDFSPSCFISNKNKAIITFPKFQIPDNFTDVIFLKHVQDGSFKLYGRPRNSEPKIEEVSVNTSIQSTRTVLSFAYFSDNYFFINIHRQNYKRIILPNITDTNGSIIDIDRYNGTGDFGIFNIVKAIWPELGLELVTRNEECRVFCKYSIPDQNIRFLQITRDNTDYLGDDYKRDKLQIIPFAVNIS